MRTYQQDLAAQHIPPPLLQISPQVTAQSGVFGVSTLDMILIEHPFRITSESLLDDFTSLKT